MAFTEEQEKTILDFITNASKTVEAPAAKVVEPVKSEEIAQTLAQEAKQQIESEKANKASLSQIESSVKFNMSISDFVEKNKNLLPDEASVILTKAGTKTFADDNEKANTIRKSLLDSFLSQKENMESLTLSMANRANEYNKLTESEKEKRSSEFWDLAEIGIALKQGIRKAEALNKINGGIAGDASGGILKQKILAAAKKKFNNEK